MSRPLRTGAQDYSDAFALNSPAPQNVQLYCKAIHSTTLLPTQEWKRPKEKDRLGGQTDSVAGWFLFGAGSGKLCAGFFALRFQESQLFSCAVGSKAADSDPELAAIPLGPKPQTPKLLKPLNP